MVQLVIVIINFQEPPIVPVTFITTGSHARLRGYEGANSLNVSLSFRTYEPRGLLIWHELSSGGNIKVCYLLTLFRSFLD